MPDELSQKPRQPAGDSGRVVRWDALSVGARLTVFWAGFSAAFMQGVFLLMLMMESPGWYNHAEQRVRYISDALAVHPGIGMALICMFFVSAQVLALCAVNLRSAPARYLFWFCLALPVSAGFAVVNYPNYGATLAQHEASTIVLFVSFAVVYVFIVGTARDSYWRVDLVLAALAAVFVGLFIGHYWTAAGAPTAAARHARESTAAVFEFLSVALYVLLNGMAPLRVRDHARS